MRHLWIVISLLGGAGALSQPSGEDLLRKIEANLAGIQDYTVALDIKVDVERVKVPQMRATMYFKQPDKTHFEAEGFAMLPREGIALNPRRLMKRFSIAEVEEVNAGTEHTYKLTLAPKEERANLTLMIVYVDPVRSTIDSITARLADRRTMTARFMYQQTEGHWLPSQSTITFSSPARDTTSEESAPDTPAPVARPGMPRSGTITVHYSSYRLNSGLSDDLFNPTKDPANR